MTTEALIGSSPAIRELAEDVELADRSSATVLIAGESGTGKESIARFIHARSTLTPSPFSVINCVGGTPESQLQAELNAPSNRTIYLDEIGEASLRIQQWLLALLEVRRGSVSPHVRVIAATRHRLLEKIRAQAFEPELYYRMNTLYLRVPPLRDRPSDIPQLLECLLERCSRLHQCPVPRLNTEAEAALMAYTWPGNLPELRDTAERLARVPRKGCLRLEDLPPWILDGVRTSSPDGGLPMAIPVPSPGRPLDRP